MSEPISESEKRDIFGIMGVKADRMEPFEHLSHATRPMIDCLNVFVNMAPKSKLTDPEEETLCRAAIMLGGICARLVNDIRQGKLKAERKRGSVEWLQRKAALEDGCNIASGCLLQQEEEGR